MPSRRNAHEPPRRASRSQSRRAQAETLRRNARAYAEHVLSAAAVRSYASHVLRHLASAARGAVVLRAGAVPGAAFLEERTAAMEAILEGHRRREGH